MTVAEYYAIAQELAPKALSDEFCKAYDMYDNSGLIVRYGGEVSAVAFALDLTASAIALAKEKGANLIVTHHPAIYKKLGALDEEGAGVGELVLAAAKAGISVFSMHLNLDIASGGVDECLAQAIRKAAGKTLQTLESEYTMCAVSARSPRGELHEGKYGRLSVLPSLTLGELAKNLKAELKAKRLSVYGEEEKVIKKVASFCGGGGNEGSVKFALDEGADAMVSSDIPHHVLLLARAHGLAVISPTHYASENYGFYQFYQRMSRQTSIPCYFSAADELL